MNPELKLLIDQGSKFLVEQGFEPSEAYRDSERLLQSTLRVSKQEFYQNTPSFIAESMERDFLSLLQKRAVRIPLQYLEGEIDFMDFSFRISPDVLIPRPETENLVERILVELKIEMDRPIKILDIGTGSGCILLALLKYFPRSSGVGIDISKGALDIARKNAVRLEVESRAFFQVSDLFESLNPGSFDLIVSNPPYVSLGEWSQLSPEVKQEPYEALVAGPSGFEYYERIISKVKRFISPGGYLFFEVGWNQADQVVAMLEQAGFSKTQKFLDDFGIDRIVKAINPHPSLSL